MPPRTQWREIHGMPLAVCFDTPQAERSAAETLALCDLSALTKLGVKGPDAERWLTEQNVEAPSDVYDSASLPNGGLVVRLASDEFLLEIGFAEASEPTPTLIEQLAANLATTQARVFSIPRQEATFLLTGSQSLEVLAQTCGVNFQQTPPRRLVYTRVAGVSCGILPDTHGGVTIYRLWVDSSYAVYLWETLAEICNELNGRVIGADWFISNGR